MNLNGKHVLVVGLGRSGRAAAEVALARGARVTAADVNTSAAPIPGATLALGPHDRALFLGADLIVPSPGIPLTQQDLAAAAAAGVPILGELGFAAAFLDAPMAAITGTNGKSTVTWFLGQLLTACGFATFTGGNLGNALCNAVLAQDRGARFDRLVVEVSSYQLETAGAFHPKAAVILNLTPDHLARHGTMDGYGAAKVKVFDHLGDGDLAVLPANDERLIRLAARSPGARAWLGQHPGVVRSGDSLAIRVPDLGLHADFSLAGFQIPGGHNRDNAGTAALLALALGAPIAGIAAALPGLQALEHRMEIVLRRDGVTWINDSKATNVDATRVGLEGLGAPVILLLGGQWKGPGFPAIAPLLQRQRAVICFGQNGPDIADELAPHGITALRVAKLADAVAAAHGLAAAGDTVLLSPGCASFDEFTDFEHRGRVFRALVNDLRESR